MWDKKMKDVNLIEPAHELTSRAGLFTTEPISSRAFFELFSSEFRASCEPRVFWTPLTAASTPPSSGTGHQCTAGQACIHWSSPGLPYLYLSPPSGNRLQILCALQHVRPLHRQLPYWSTSSSSSSSRSSSCSTSSTSCSSRPTSGSCTRDPC